MEDGMFPAGRVTRRQFAALGAAVAAAGVLQACSGGGQTPQAPPAAPTPTGPPATLISQPFQQATPTATAAAAASQPTSQPAAIPPRPTPVGQTLDIEFAIERGEGDHYVLSAQEN